MMAARPRASHRAIRRASLLLAAALSRVQCKRWFCASGTALRAVFQRADSLPQTHPACGHRCVCWRAASPCASAATPPLPGAKATGKGGRQDKRGRHLSACNTCLHVGGAQHDAALPLCCLGRECRAVTAMSACFARPDTPQFYENAAMNDRRDDDFRIRPNAPKNRRQGFISKVLKQTGKASSGKSSVRRSGTGHRPGSRLGRGHTAARFAGARLMPFSRRVSIKTLLVNQRHASPQSLARHLRYIERDGVGRNGEAGRAYGPLTDEADLDTFKERCADDRHHFRFILSNGWGRVPNWKSARPCSARWNRNAGRALTRPCSVKRWTV